MAGLSRKEQKTLLTSMEKQGATLVEKANGTLIFFPQGESTMVHRTPSDMNGHKPIRSMALRSGFEWPFDGQRPKKTNEEAGSTMANLNHLDKKVLISSLEKQGSIIETRGSKTLVRFPDGSQTVLPADGESIGQNRYDVRRAGLFWPWDSAQEPISLAKPRPSIAKGSSQRVQIMEPQATLPVRAVRGLKKGQKVPSSHEADTLVLEFVTDQTQVSTSEAIKKTGLTLPTILKRLRTLNWVQDSSLGRGVWTPAPQAGEVEKYYPEIEKARTALQALASVKKPDIPEVVAEPVSTPLVAAEVTLKSSRNSYTADLNLIGQMTVEQLSAAYNAASPEMLEAQRAVNSAARAISEARQNKLHAAAKLRRSKRRNGGHK
jgi:hypothetical protein